MSSSDKVKIIRPQEGFQEKFVRTNVDLCIAGGVLNCGKCNPLRTKVLTPKGWVRMGDLKVGDFVNTPFGKPCRVLEIYEHKGKDIYEITTSDNRKSLCSFEHLWSVRTRKQLESYRKNKDVSKNLTTCETSKLIQMLEEGKEIYLPIPKAQEFKEKEYTIPPYVLGVMLGDGCLTDSSYRSNTNIVISSAEMDIVDKVCDLCNYTRLYIKPSSFEKVIFFDKAKQFREYIHSVGLNTYSYNKFIPKEYLYGSIEQRRQLLYGLFDTDGSVCKGNSFTYSTTSKKLAEDIIYLCRSLGYIVTITLDERENKYTCGVSYRLFIQTDEVIFSSEKHLRRYKHNLSIAKKYKKNNSHVRIQSIEKVSKEDARCIWIDDPLHLYIIDDFMTTHNTFAAVLSVAEPSKDGRFRGLFLRNNLADARASGGLLDTFKEVYGEGCEVVESGEPRVTFPSGSKIDVTHVADQGRDKVLQRFKGRQYDYIYFDEGTGFTWECFTAIYSRNRGTAAWTGKVRMTTNPDRDHWLRTFLDWYIGIDGFIREDREGVIRYFYMAGETVKDVVWGDSKEEVYNQCKIQIDRVLAKVNGKTGTATYKDIIKSFTFYLGRMSENKASIGNNKGYVGSVALTGGRNAQQLLEGNWNVSMRDELDAPIPSDVANQVFMNDPQINGDKWVTCDLADTGTDNFLCLAWDGFHIFDILILGHTTPRENAERLEIFAADHDISNSHIIYDAIRGTYINDYIPEAIPFVSYRAPMGLYGRMAQKLKDECYMRLVELIKRGQFSMSDRVSLRIYEHQKLKENITIQNEFIEECSVVRFKEVGSGKKTLLSKKEMNQKLGKGRSMDLLDPCAMRMLPVLEFPYGEELEKTMCLLDEDGDEMEAEGSQSIYDNSLWC